MLPLDAVGNNRMVGPFSFFFLFSPFLFIVGWQTPFGCIPATFRIVDQNGYFPTTLNPPIISSVLLSDEIALYPLNFKLNFTL